MELIVTIILLAGVIKMVKFLFADNEIYSLRQTRNGTIVEEPNAFKVFCRGLLRIIVLFILIMLLLSCCSAF